MTQYIHIIGYPLKHSVSPAMQQAALNHYQLDVHYEIWETKAEELPLAFKKLRQDENLGATVTVPYKETVLDLLDEINEQAKLIGAVNTIVNRNGRLTGFNTDAHGFIEALRKEGQFNPRGKQAILIGAGGVARAAGFALVQEGIASLMIANRTDKRAEELQKALVKYIHHKDLHTKVITLPWSLLKNNETMKNCHLIVNCTSMGMRYSALEYESPVESDVIPSSALVYDLVYNPPETPLLKLAAKAGAQTLSGLPMLIYQGVTGFEIWTGKKAPVEVMFSAAKTALGIL
jgi:shikimate dehydrogenase